MQAGPYLRRDLRPADAGCVACSDAGASDARAIEFDH